MKDRTRQIHADLAKLESEQANESEEYTYAMAEVEGKIKKDSRGNIDCSGLGLTSLAGAPQKVSGDFYCSYNKLTSLEGMPKHIGGKFST